MAIVFQTQEMRMMKFAIVNQKAVFNPSLWMKV